MIRFFRALKRPRIVYKKGFFGVGKSQWTNSFAMNSNRH